VDQPIRIEQTGRAVTKVKRSGMWHAWQITLTLCTGGLWGFVYLAKWLKGRSVYTQTTYRP
jgi:hypothetical protein